MVQVPRAEQQVRRTTQPLPPRPLRPTAEEFGAGAAAGAVQREIQAGLGQVAEIQRQEVKRAQRIRHRDLDAKLATESTRLKVELSKLKRENAIGAAEKTLAEYEDFWKTMQGTITDRGVLDAATQSFESRKVTLNSFAQPYEQREAEAFSDAVYVEHQKALQDDALLSFEDPVAVAESIQARIAATVDYAKEKGLPDDWIRNRSEEIVSSTHAGVISQYLSQRRGAEAREYFERNKRNLTGRDLENMTLAVQEGDVREQSQVITDEIMATEGITEPEALKRARKLEGDLEDMVVNRVKERFRERDAFQRQQQADIYEFYATLVSDPANAGVPFDDLVPPQIRMNPNLMPDRNRVALQRRRKPVMDWDVYWKLQEIREKNPGQLADWPIDVWESMWWSKFDEPRRREVAKWREDAVKIRRGDTDKEIEVTNIINLKDYARAQMRDLELVDLPDRTRDEVYEDNERFDLFWREVEREIQRRERPDPGKPAVRKLNKQEQRDVVLDTLEDMKKQTVILDRPFWRGDVRVSTLPLTREQRQSAYEDIKNISETEVEAIKSEIRNAGKKPTADLVQRIYAAKVLKDEKLRLSILSE